MPSVGALQLRCILILLPLSQLVELLFEAASPLLLLSQLFKLHFLAVKRASFVEHEVLRSFYLAFFVDFHRLGESDVTLIDLVASRLLVRL